MCNNECTCEFKQLFGVKHLYNGAADYTRTPYLHQQNLNGGGGLRQSGRLTIDKQNLPILMTPTVVPYFEINVFFLIMKIHCIFTNHSGVILV